MHAAAPMWRNGRRNGLKIRSRESGVWVRIPSSAPSKLRLLLGKLVRRYDFVDYERSRTETHENTIYSPSISQVSHVGTACDAWNCGISPV
jgi:hypothetical protein